MKVLKNHLLDKPVLRELFWFIVLPHRLKQEIAKDLKSGHLVRKNGRLVLCTNPPAKS